ncbi:MAG: ribosome silencing factor [Oscillospiraceae bacterium]
MTPKEIAETVVKTLDGKKAHDIRLLRTTDVTVLADYFVICTATSTTQIRTLADEVEAVLEEKGETKLHREGHREGGWVLLDFGCVVVHLFMDEARKFYNLERLWADAEEVDLSALLGPND